MGLFCLGRLLRHSISRNDMYFYFVILSEAVNPAIDGLRIC